MNKIIFACSLMLLLQASGCKRGEQESDTSTSAIDTNITVDTNAADVANATEELATQEVEIIDTSATAPFPPPATNLVWIPAGIFIMGSPDGDPDRNDAEGPQSKVTLRNGFWIGKYEVTQAEYLSVMGSIPRGGKGDLSRPVDSVSWNDAMNYCAKINVTEKQSGRLPEGFAYRLPTEAEWEYAARAGKTNRFSFGDDIGFKKLKRYAWTSENNGTDIHPVGQKAPNAWGLFDIYGNVSEWCQDWFGVYTAEDKVNPMGPATGKDRVYRGGSWGDPAANSRCAERGGLAPVSRVSSIGFRVVLASVQP